MKNNISAIRKEKNITQKDLAEKIGISHYWLNHIENGKRNPSITLMQKIANELQVQTRDLFID